MRLQVIDRQNTNSGDIRQLEFDVGEEQKRAETLNEAAELLFRQRQVCKFL